MEDGKCVPTPPGTGLVYQDADGNIVYPDCSDEDILFHIGTNIDLLTAGIFKPACHAAVVPEVRSNYMRVQQAFEFAPKPNTVLSPPIAYDIPNVIPGDENRIIPQIGIRRNWTEGITYAQYQENMLDTYVKYTNVCYLEMKGTR